MSDQSFHEIQLSGKQLVFLFMCAVILTVVVFLFGVSVGREVRSPVTQTASTPAAPTDATMPAETPPPTQTTPNELSYAQALQGREGEDPSKATPPAPASEEPPAAATPEKTALPPPPVKAAKKDAAPTATPPPVVSSPPTPAPKAAAQPPATKPLPPLNGFFVQVEAFSSTDIAAKEVTKLRGKGYPAFVFNEADNTPGPRYKVRVGPYSARSEADRTLKSLSKEGYKPLIKR
jgi:DedD protein